MDILLLDDWIVDKRKGKRGCLGIMDWRIGGRTGKLRLNSGDQER